MHYRFRAFAVAYIGYRKADTVRLVMNDDPIELLLAKIVAEPSNVELHRQLRAAGIRQRATGGSRASVLERALPLPSDPLRRLIHLERLWTRDPADLELLRQFTSALEELAAACPEADFTAVARWLKGLWDGSRTN